MNNENELNNVSTLHFPIVIGENRSARVVIVHLINGEDDYKEKRVVITENGAASDALFKIPKQVRIVDQSGASCKQISFKGPESGGWFNNLKTALVDKIADKESTTLTVKIGEKTMKPNTFDTNYVKYYVGSDKFDDIVEFECTVKKDAEEKVYVGKLHIVRLRRTDRLVKLTADLGSDATQVNYAINDGRVNSVKLVDGMMEAYKGRKYPGDRETEKAVFTQEEGNSPTYFKTGSITYKDKGYIDKGIDDPETLINYLTVSAAGKTMGYGDNTIYTIEDGFDKKLVNIKMLYAESLPSGYVHAKKTIDFSFRKGTAQKPQDLDDVGLVEIMNTIYKQIIDVSTNEINDPEKPCKYYSVMLLVPNIYIQPNIDNLLYYLNDLMNEEYGKDIEPGKDGAQNAKHNLYDFRVISESDSAFIGLNAVKRGRRNLSLIDDFLFRKKVTEKKKKDTFLVIDSGKGTTDYSIISYKGAGKSTANNSISSLERGGIVGAGGAIDYVFARVFARQIYKHRMEIVTSQDLQNMNCADEEEFIERFMTFVQTLVPRDQDRLMLLIEELKISYVEDDEGGRKVAKVADIYKYFTGNDNDATNIVLYLLDKKNVIQDIKVDQGEDQGEGKKQDSSLASGFKALNLHKQVNALIPVTAQDENEINCLCRLIASAIVDHMVFELGNTKLTKKIDYVIFTGRSFLFKPLKKAFLDALDAEDRRGLYLVNVNSDKILKNGIDYLKVRQMKKNQDMGYKEYYNLKVADIDDMEERMKPISIQYNNHNMGVNCNSNLCCLNGLSDQNKEASISLERFWKGFEVGTTAKTKKRYYYIGFKNISFATNDKDFISDQNNGLTYNEIPPEFKKPLIDMTLFPVKYYKVDVVKAYEEACKKANADKKPSDGDKNQDASDSGNRKEDFRKQKEEEGLWSGTEETDPEDMILDDNNEIDNADEHERKDL